MTLFVSLRAFANFATVPPVLPIDLRQEHLARPRLVALSAIDAALAKGRPRRHRDARVCRRGLLPVGAGRRVRSRGSLRSLDQSCAGRTGGLRRASRGFDDIGLYANVHETANRIAATTPRG